MKVIRKFRFLLVCILLVNLLAGAISAAEQITGVRSGQKLFVDGKQVSMTAYNINGNNYLQLRDVGRTVGFNVYWDGSNVQVQTGVAYTGVAPGAEQTAAPALNTAASEWVTGVPSNQKILIDGTEVSMTAYNINGSNYLQLREVGQAVGFNVYWDGSSVQVQTGVSYTGQPPAAEQAGDLTVAYPNNPKTTQITNDRGQSDELTEWDCIRFGHYPQSDAAGDQFEPILWRVLYVDGNDAFLISDSILDCKQYNPGSKTVTWEQSALREWLNGEFFSKAFSSKEQAAIIATSVTNPANPYMSSEAGNDTFDRIYVLSVSETLNPQYGFLSTYNIKSETRYAKVSPYAVANGAFSSGEGIGLWTTRTAGFFDTVAYVSQNGEVIVAGHKNSNRETGVRPCLHLNLSNPVWESAGTVTSKGVTHTDTSADADTHTSEKGLCYVCGGTGKVEERCVACNGHGSKTCSRCSGSGSTLCTSCGASGTVYNSLNGTRSKCAKCHGSGTLSCNKCFGLGKISCADCNGDGKRSVTCSNCKGKGSI